MSLSHIEQFPRFLIIDDEVDITEIVKDFINESIQEEKHITVLNYYDEKIHKNLLKDHQIIFLDIHMPGTYGDQIIDHIKAVNPRAQIVIITGNATFMVALKCYNEGVRFFLHKPFTYENIKLVANSCYQYVTHWSKLFNKLKKK